MDSGAQCDSSWGSWVVGQREINHGGGGGSSSRRQGERERGREREREREKGRLTSIRRGSHDLVPFPDTIPDQTVSELYVCVRSGQVVEVVVFEHFFVDGILATGCEEEGECDE